MQKLLIATSNPGKFNEIMEVISDLPFEFLSLKDVEVDYSDLKEDGESFYENSFIKAKYFRDKTGYLTLAEDSGILVDALTGELGVKTRRWGAGENASDDEWMSFFMERMMNEENRAASFVCNACVLGNDYREHFEGETKGVLMKEIMAPIIPGIPLSSCFVAEGCDKVYALMNEAEKNMVSHRGKAMHKLKVFLQSIA
ncbi:non-canonical purine NTP pyrophosphatase [Candidatus Peregrinibacteria bacterium CG10_big_fil_rev_8_21_14_0_10_36_19]|nr:MAG: non-canonical purine NTP pyrophosphatase [Candidatus Peregrinibacteria bacterium CG10_big_fil_rev_8_21_14_0_10_36_19]